MVEAHAPKAGQVMAEFDLVQHCRNGEILLRNYYLIHIKHGYELIVVHVLVKTVVLSNLFVADMAVKVPGEEQILLELVIWLVSRQGQIGQLQESHP